MELAENCPNLRYLCISNCGHVTDQSLVALATYCQGLVTLECAAVSQLTDAGFQVRYTDKKIFQFHFPAKIFHTPNCQKYQALARSCHHLERMDLEECVLITDSSISQLAAHCPCLESLSLSHCELITDEAIR